MAASGNEPGVAPWQVLDKRALYHSPWVGLEHWSVRLPDGSLIPDHHVVIYPRQAVGVTPRDRAGNFLLIDHYRFITDSRGWEIPAGQIEEMESVAEAAARELLEETGHRSTQWRALGRYFPSNGSSNQVFHVLLAEELQEVTTVVDTNETLNRRWFSEREVRAMVVNNEIRDGFSLTALMWALMA